MKMELECTLFRWFLWGGKLWQECALASTAGLTVKKWLFVVVSLELSKYSVMKATYSGISLVSWLEWKGKDSERHSHETRRWCTQTNGVRLKDKHHTTGTLHILKKHTHIIWVLQPVVCQWVCWSAGCGPLFTPLSVCVKSCWTKIWRRMLPVFSGLLHKHKLVPTLYMEKRVKMSDKLPEGVGFLPPAAPFFKYLL